MITQLELIRLLNYNPNTGLFIWLISTARRIKVGDIAGSLNNRGYITIIINGKSYKAHRLAFLYMTGNWPKDQVDHINMIKSDNRWNNLREANTSQNKGNSLKHNDNKSGVKGVYWNKTINKWCAQIGVNSKTIHLGYFDNIEDAKIAYETAAIKHFGEYARYDTFA